MRAARIAVTPGNPAEPCLRLLGPITWKGQAWGDSRNKSTDRRVAFVEFDRRYFGSYPIMGEF
jgi:hypothetical protein